MDQVDIIVRGLKSVEEYIDGTFSKFTAYLVATKLDFRTNKNWELSQTSYSDFPTYK